MTGQAIVVKEYKDRDAFNEDAQRMAAQGYAVTNVVENNRRSGCMRILLLGIFAMIFKPKPMLIVTYQMQPPMPPR